MKQSHTSRNYAKAFFAFVTIGLAGACADSNVAPTTAEVAAFKAPAAFNRKDGVVKFTVNNNKGITQRLGEHVITIPAGAICALNSTYGPTEWRKPCTELQGSVTITATLLRDDENHPYVDFQPAMRFAPNKVVMLFLRNGRSTHATQLGINYCTNLGECYDESVNYPEFKPFRVGKTSMIGMRVGHFSGYVVAYGDPCAGSLTQEPDGTWMCNEDGLARRSGYMVASGLVKENDDAKDEEKDGKKKDDSQF